MQFDDFYSFRVTFDIVKEIMIVYVKLGAFLIMSIILDLNYQSLIFLRKLERFEPNKLKVS